MRVDAEMEEGRTVIACSPFWGNTYDDYGFLRVSVT